MWAATGKRRVRKTPVVCVMDTKTAVDGSVTPVVSGNGSGDVTPVVPADMSVMTRSAKTPKTPKTPKTVGVVGTAPNGFDALRDALNAVRTGTDMKPETLRRDAANVSRAIERAIGKRAIPPAGRGRFTGLRTYDFQNTLYAVNDRADWRFSDRALCIAWLVELCANKCDFAVKSHYVGSTRTDYVNGRHGSNVIDPAHRVSTVWPIPTTA